MKAKLIDGDLYVLRTGGWRAQLCPFASRRLACGEWCPLFHESYFDCRPCQGPTYTLKEMEYVIETAEKGIWVTAEDEEIKIKDMKKDHIVNCLNMMQRNKDTFVLELYKKQFLDELKRRHKEGEDA